MYTGGKRKARRCCNRRFASNDRDRCNNHFSFGVNGDIYIYIYVSIAFLYNNFSGITFNEFEFSCSRIKKIERDSFLCDVCYATKLSDDRRRDLISIFPH